MAYPQVAATNTSSTESNSTSHTVSLPTGISALDLLVVFFSTDGDNIATFPAGWTKIFSADNGTNNHLSIAYRFAAGSEGSTITVTTDSSEYSAHVSYRITGADSAEVSSGATGTSSSPDPDSVTASWGSSDNLFIAVCGWDRDDTINTYPYADNNTTKPIGGSAGCGIAVCSDEITSATQNPGTFSMSGSDEWVAATVVVGKANPTYARPTATNENISTYGGAGLGRDYTSLSAWTTDTAVNMVSAAQSEVLECYNDEVFDDSCSFYGATSNSSYFRIIRPAPGQGHGGNPTKGVRFVKTTGGSVFSGGALNAEGYWQVQDLVVGHNISAIESTTGVNLANAPYAVVIGMIGYNYTGGNTASKGILTNNWQAAGHNHYVIDCTVIGNPGWGFYVSSKNDSCYFYNCTAIDNAAGGFNSNGQNVGVTTYVKNCLSKGNPSGYDFWYEQSGSYSGNNNASSDSTAPGTNSRTSQTFTFRDSYGHLASNDAGALGYGASLSSDSNFAFNYDIDGQLRLRWDIGADEFYALVANILTINSVAVANISTIDTTTYSNIESISTVDREV